ncbi:methyl-accepting chemotaxis protein [Thermodesulfobacteriota bacterium]
MINIAEALWKKTRMRTKFLVATTLIVGLFVGFSLYKNIVYHTDTAMEQVAEFSNALLENTYSTMKFPMSMGDSKTVEEQLKSIKANMSGIQVYISDFNQDIIYASEDSRIHENMADYLHSEDARKALEETLHSGIVPDKSFKDIESNEPFLVTIKPIFNETSCYHCHTDYREVLGSIIVKKSIRNVLGSIQDARNFLILYSALAILGLIVFINFLFSRLVTSRIEKLKDKTSQVAAGDITVKSRDDYEDSVGKLAHNFNLMVKSIQDRMEYANSLKLGISDPFFIVDPEMEITFVNEAMARIAGRSQKDIVGKSCYDVFNSTVCENGCPLKKALRTGEATVGLKFSIINTRGIEIPLMASSAALKDSSSKILGGFVILRDLTVEVKGEKMLKEAYLREEEAKEALEKKVKDISEVFRRVGQGDFTLRGVPTGTGDAMDVLTGRLNETLDAMVGLISQVKNHINPVIKGVRHISKENQNLSHRTEQQTAAMEKISSTLEELVSNTTENLENNRRVDSLSKGAVQVAHDGGNLVEKTAQAMEDVSEASLKIVEMMELINDITFQTNLLSINAAVEAARAGEHGRGFGVVASEVRNLANSSSKSAKDIQMLVKETMESSSIARQWVGELQEYFTKIVQTSGEVSEALEEISLGNEESSSGIEHISIGIQEICEVNEKNSCFVDQIAAETGTLYEGALQLQKITEVFILGKDAEPQQEAMPIESDLGPNGNERRKPSVIDTNRPLQQDLLNKSDVNDHDNDLLDQTFDEGFEEF